MLTTTAKHTHTRDDEEGLQWECENSVKDSVKDNVKEKGTNTTTRGTIVRKNEIASVTHGSHVGASLRRLLCNSMRNAVGSNTQRRAVAAGCEHTYATGGDDQVVVAVVGVERRGERPCTATHSGFARIAASTPSPSIHTGRVHVPATETMSFSDLHTGAGAHARTHAHTHTHQSPTAWMKTLLLP